MSRNELVEKNIKLAYFVAARFQNCGIEYEDLVSICFLGLIKAADTYNPERSKFSSYACRIMENEVLQEIRRVKRRKCRTVSLDGEIGEEHDSFYEIVPDPHDCYAKFTASCLYKSWMGLLTDMEKSAVYLTLIEGKTQSEAARRMGISQSYVSRIYKGAAEKMKRKLT